MQCSCLEMKNMILINISDSHHEIVSLLLTFCKMLGLVRPFADGSYTNVLTCCTLLVQVTACVLSTWIAVLYSSPGQCWPVSDLVYYWPAQHSCVKCMQTGHYCTYKTFLNNSGPNIMHKWYTTQAKSLVHNRNHWYMLEQDHTLLAVGEWQMHTFTPSRLNKLPCCSEQSANSQGMLVMRIFGPCLLLCLRSSLSYTCRCRPSLRQTVLATI